MRERRTLALAGAGLLALVVIGLLVFIAVRPAPASPPVSTATPAPAATPTPSPSGQSTSGNVEQQRQQYQDYVSVVLTDGTALAASTGRLNNCGRGNPQACLGALKGVRDSNATFEQHLDATPPPACLVDANSQLRTGLGLQAKGLDLTASAVSQRDTVTLAQGTMLFTASNWWITQAVRASRQSHC